MKIYCVYPKNVRCFRKIFFLFVFSRAVCHSLISSLNNYCFFCRVIIFFYYLLLFDYNINYEKLQMDKNVSFIYNIDCNLSKGPCTTWWIGYSIIICKEINYLWTFWTKYNVGDSNQNFLNQQKIICVYFNLF